MSDYTSWHVGMKVVCVDDSPGRLGGEHLHLGQIYTISRIEADEFPVVAVQVAELKFRWDEFARASRFRPVQTRKTDISVFQAMLSPTNVEA